MIPAAKLGAFGIVCFGALVLDEKTGVSIGTILAVFGGVWWLGRKLQALEDVHAEIKRRLDRLPCGMCATQKHNL